MQYHYIPIRLAKIQHINNTQIWSDRNTHLLLVGKPNGTATLEDRLAISYKIKHNLTSRYPAITLLSIYSNELKSCVHTKTCTQMFIAALFINGKMWKQLRRLSVNEWVNQLWYIHTTAYYSALKRNELSSCEKT